MGTELSTPDNLKEMLKDSKYINLYANYITFEELGKKEAWKKTFGIEGDFTNTLTVRMYRWISSEPVRKAMDKANKEG